MKLENAGWVNKMVKKLFTVKQAGYEISVEAEQMNCDLIVNLFGGDVLILVVLLAKHGSKVK